MTPAQSRDRLAELVLLRMLPRARPLKNPSVLASDLAPFFRTPPDEASISAALQRLRAQGLVDHQVLRLTDSGRTRAIGTLGAAGADWRPEMRWPTVRARLLPKMVLGVRRPPARDELIGLLLAKALGLPADAARSTRCALEALVCQTLGYPELASLDELFTKVLAEHIGADGLTTEALLEQAPRVLLGLPRVDDGALRDELLRSWFDPPDTSLVAFAAGVHDAARSARSGRFGPGRVFIAHVWEELRQRQGSGQADLDTFKQRLVEAYAEGLVALSRADLVQLLNPEDVVRSETRGRNAVFHFVRIEPP